MDYCCRLLGELKEYQTDKLIPHLVRNQELSCRIADTFSYDDLNNSELRGEFLVNLTSETFIRELDRLQLEVPLDLQKNSKIAFPFIELPPVHKLLTQKVALLDLEFHVIRIMINEAALHPEFWTCANESNQVPDLTSLSVARSKMLWRSLNSCKGFIHTFLSYRNQDLFYLTAFIYPRLCYVFITIAKLVFLDSDSRGVGWSNQSDTLDFHNRPWSMMNIAKEADFQGLGKRVLEKFTTVATNFVGADGQRDAMSNLASAMRILMAGYAQQMNEIQGGLHPAETSASTVEIIQEHTSAAVDSTAYSSVQGLGNGSDSGTFDIGFNWDSYSNTVWDDMLENFTMVPFS
jgi:hypothetical protein